MIIKIFTGKTVTEDNLCLPDTYCNFNSALISPVYSLIAGHQSNQWSYLLRNRFWKPLFSFFRCDPKMTFTLCWSRCAPLPFSLKAIKGHRGWIFNVPSRSLDISAPFACQLWNGIRICWVSPLMYPGGFLAWVYLYGRPFVALFSYRGIFRLKLFEFHWCLFDE